MSVFHLTVSPFELLVRGSVMYVLLLMIFRFVLRRDTGSAGVPDVLFVVLLGDAAQNGMIGEGTSIGDAACLVAVLAGWNYALDWLAYRYRWAARLTDPPKVLLVRDGIPQRRNLRRERITMDEIESAARGHGLDGLAGVRRMYFEPDGSFSVLKAGAESA